jgi:hypothetical protein
MLLVKDTFLTLLFRIKACFFGKSVTFYYELILFEFKTTTATAKIKVWTGRDLSLAYRWIQHPHSFKGYVLKIVHWPAARIRSRSMILGSSGCEFIEILDLMKQ